MKKSFILLFLFFSAISSFADKDSVAYKKPFLGRVASMFIKMMDKFNEIDSDYIEPQHYNYTVMLQNTNTYEMYRIKSKQGQSILLSPEISPKVGPYVGWRWMFLGYTFDLSHISDKYTMKKEFNLSIYSSMIGIDLFYRQTGNDYKMRSVYLGEGVNTRPLNGLSFSGINVGIKGFNVYYIFNHRKFSYPAAFSQSTCQKKSCGSFLLGMGYTRHTLKLDYNKLNETITDHMPELEAKLDSGLMFNSIKYTDVSVSGGYAYNYVFAHNWLLAASLSAAIGYKRSSGDIQTKEMTFRDFLFNNLNIDGVGRFGLVWNNTRWYAGASAILHSYNYRKTQFSTNNFFGSLNLYFGYNFGLRKH